MSLNDVFDRVELLPMARHKLDQVKLILPDHYSDAQALNYLIVRGNELSEYVTFEQYSIAHQTSMGMTETNQERIEHSIAQETKSEVPRVRKDNCSTWYCGKCGKTTQPTITGLGANQIFCGNCGNGLRGNQ